MVDRAWRDLARVWAIALCFGLLVAPTAAQTTAQEIEAFIASDTFRSAPLDVQLDMLNERLEALPEDADRVVWARLVYHRLNAMARVGNLDAAKPFLDEIKDEFYAIIQNTDFYVDALYPAAFISVYSGDVEAALAIVARMKDAPGFDETTKYQQYADNVLVMLYTNTGNSILAADVLIQSYESEKIDAYTPLEQLKLLTNIGYALVRGDDFNKAERYLSLGRAELSRVAGSGLLTDSETIQVGWHLNENLANLYIQQERFEELAAIIPAMVEGADYLGSPLLDIRTELVRAAYLFGEGRAEEAAEKLKLIPTLSANIGAIDLKIMYYDLYSKVLGKLGRYQESLEAYQESRAAEKASSSEQARARAEFLQAQLNLQQQTHEIERLEAETEAVRIIRKRERYILALSLLGLIAATVFTALLFVSQKRLKRIAEDLAASEQKAQGAANAKAAFLANMSHEIRTPLNGLMGMAQILSTRALAEEDRKCIDVIVSSGEILLAVVNDVLDISKIEAGKMAIDRVPTNIHANIEQLFQLWRPKAAEKGVSLNYAIDDQAPAQLSVDPVRLRQCVSNLMSNAIKFTNEGEVRVEVSYTAGDDASTPERGDLIISVCDTGAGIKKEAIDRLFTAFEHADSSTTRKFGGTGLGLSITAELCALMGGGIDVDSEVGVGSRFTMTIPAASDVSTTCADEVAAGAPNAEGRPNGDRAAARILIVDDNHVNRMVARAFIADHAESAAEAANGREALAMLRNDAFDLMLLDMHMPVMDGPATIKAVRGADEAWSAIPIITLTADAMAGDRERYIELGTDGYVAKPLVKDELIAEIEHVMRGAAHKAEQAA